MPVWHDDAGAWGQLASPTRHNVQACEDRLKAFLSRHASPEQWQQTIANCKKADAEYEVQIDELHKQMFLS